MKNVVFFLCTFWSAGIFAQTPFHIGIAEASVSATEKVFNIYVSDFESILAMQYSLSFDGDKMSFAGIQNSILGNLTPENFYNPTPGSLTSVWLNSVFNPEDYIDSTVLFQLVFDVLQPGGSTLCFADTPTDYSFVQGDEDITLDIFTFYIHDACYNGIIELNPNGLDDPAASENIFIHGVYMDERGQFTFTSPDPQTLSFKLYDLLGKQLGFIPARSFDTGNQSATFDHRLFPGEYFLQVITESKERQAIPVFVK